MNKILDLSEHNGNIDFEKVKNDGIDGLILRVGWLGNYENHTLDKKFNEYYINAKKLGFKIGCYVYSYCKTIEALRNGIDWLLNQIENKNLNLPVFLDLEDEQIENFEKEHLTNQAKQFCKIIENCGYKSGIYANKYWFLNKLNINELLNYTIWLAEWNEKENHTLNYRVDLWQYTSKGKINGINGNVDINKNINLCETSVNNELSNKTIEELAKEVIDGKYGNGEERKKALGYLYNEVQSRVNEILNSKKEYYIIQKGDNLTKIAKKFNTTINSLVLWNNIKNPNLIYAGQRIRVK